MTGLPPAWCERCWTHHAHGDHDERDPGRRRKRSSGAAIGQSRGPGEWLGDLFEAVVDFFTSLRGD